MRSNLFIALVSDFLLTRRFVNEISVAFLISKLTVKSQQNDSFQQKAKQPKQITELSISSSVFVL